MPKTAHPTQNPRRRAKRALAKLGTVEKRPKSGHNVSHAQNKNKRLFRPNLQKTKVLIDGKPVRVKLDAKSLRSLTKINKQYGSKQPRAKKTSAKS